jgi:hypothetical protein
MRTLMLMLCLACATAAQAKAYFADPYDLRSTAISEVRELRGGTDGKAVIENGICVTLNARNQLGGYTGVDTYVFVVPEPGRLQYGDYRWNVSSSTCRVEGVSYAPFPELGQIR